MSEQNTRLLTIADLAAELQVPTKTIYNWRAHQPPRGPSGITIGKHVRFRRADVDSWLQSLL